jgi:chemotaxis methyl-accepting protein methylase
MILKKKPARSKDFSSILNLLESTTGVDFSQYKQATLERRINRRMQLAKMTSIAAYLKLLKSDSSELEQLFEEVTIHVSDFFRDMESFIQLEAKVFPKIFSKEDKKAIRVWIPACSSGQEPYSVAMLMLEYAEINKHTLPIQIFATDVSEESIRKARMGVYSNQDVANIPEKYLKKYFTKVGSTYKISKVLRNTCVFAKHDITNDSSFSQMDLICCRNLLIYFNHATQKKCFHTFNYALRAEGFLFLGHEESLSKVSDYFTPVDRRNSLFKKIVVKKNVAPKIKAPKLSLSRSDHKEFLKFVTAFNLKMIKTSKGPEKSVTKINKDLKEMYAYFEKLVENQTALYEELQATHEEVLSSNEELLSKNEEFENTHEELQATNEELRSINDEMIDRNHDLNRLNDEINEERDFSQAIVDTIREPILILDERLIVQSVNLPYLKAFQVSEDETVDSPLFMLGNNQWDIPSLKSNLLALIPQNNTFKDFEIEHDFPKIGKKNFSLNARQLILPYSSRKYILLAMEDVTIRNLMQERIQMNFDTLEVEKNVSDATVSRLEEERALRERFVSTLTHDLRNPLAAANMASQLIMRNVDNVEKVTKLNVRILSSLERVDLMIKNLLDANQIQAGEGIIINIDHCNAHEILNLVVDDMISLHGDRFIIHSTGSLDIESDSSGLRRILENLISNAVKYGDPTTKITVSLNKYNDNIFKFNVQNFGPVIHAKDLNMIFHQFGRTHSAQTSSKVGWGLGLTLVKGISRALGGDVSVSSHSQKGTIFSVQLPIHTNLQRGEHEL